jgi:hypothetical protein
MSELYIYDDDLVEDYNLIGTLANYISELNREKLKELKKNENTVSNDNDNSNNNKNEQTQSKPINKSVIKFTE